MSKVTGIKSVDVKIKASGRGVVNWNGNGQFKEQNLKVPKMKNINPKEMMSGTNGDFLGSKSVTNVDLTKAQMFISQNCLRQALFAEETDALVAYKSVEAPDLLLSVAGLLRGYAIADGESPLMRKSPLYISDLDSQNSPLHYEYLANSGSKKSETGGFFSKVSAGNSAYEGLASINIQDLQFISTDGVYGRPQTEPMNDQDGSEFAQKISSFLKTLDSSKNPSAEYGFWKRISSTNKGGEWGVLLNNDAIEILVSIMLEKIENLSIRRTSGFMQVDIVVVDFNDSSKMRVLSMESSSVKDSKYATFYEKGSDSDLKDRNDLSGTYETNVSAKAAKKAEKEKRKEAAKKKD